MPDHNPQAVDGGKHHRPQHILQYLAVAGFLLIFPLAGCQSPHTVSLALLGDLMLGRGIQPRLESLAFLKPEISSIDLALANLESPFATVLTALSSAYNLCTASVHADLLPAWGFDLLSIANNHNLDCGPNGPAETISILQAAGITTVGPGMEAIYREVNGIQLAFLAFDDISSPLDESSALQAIQAAHSDGAQVVVSVHWGSEYQVGISDRQKTLAQEFAQAGAALIWGHHPHVLQPAGWIETVKGNTLVLYSLGNSLFDQAGLDDSRRSALVKVTLDKRGVRSVLSVPFEIDIVNSRVVQPDEESTRKIQGGFELP